MTRRTGTMAANGRRYSPRLIQLRSGCSALTLLLAAGGLVALTTAPTLAACSIAGDTLTCIGDLSAGVDQSSATVTTVNINSLTEDIGTNGVRFRNTANLDVDFDVDLLPHAIVVNPSASATARNGFHIITDGAISGTIVGDVTGRSGQDESISGNTLIHGHHGFFGLEASEDINLDFTGDVIVQAPDLTVSSSFVAAVNSRRFAAIRVETEDGDIGIVHQGDIVLTDSDITAISTDASGSNRALATSTSGSQQFETYGFFARGDSTLELENNGAITINGGTGTATASSQGGRAEAIASSAQVGGIVLSPLETFIGTQADVQFDSAAINQTGDVTVTVGASIADAQSTTTGSAPSQAAAVSGSLNTHTGIRMIDGPVANLDLVGDVTVSAGMARATANALIAGDTEPGLVYVSASGALIRGIEVRGNFNPDQLPEIANLAIDGDVTVMAGAAEAIARGSGAAPTTASGFPPVSTEPAQTAVRASGGDARGIQVQQFGEGIDLTIDGQILAVGGDAGASVTGSDLSVNVSGGLGAGLLAGDVFGSARVTFSPDTTITARGGDATAVHDGSGFRARASGGSATGMTHNFAFTGDFENIAPITVRGGDASISGTGVIESRASGGGALGLSVDSHAPNSDNGTPIGVYTNTAPINVVGGSATTTGTDGQAFGGNATGMSLDVPDFVSLGEVNVTGGSGDTHDGAVFGIATDGYFVPGQTSPDTPARTYRILGDVTAMGQGYAIEDLATGLSSLSSGVLMTSVGLSLLDVQGAAIASTGDHVHGIVAASEFDRVIIRSGSVVSSDGLGASGIEVRPYSLRITVFEPEMVVAGNTVDILVEQGASVASLQGVGIHDDDRAVYEFVEFDGTGIVYTPQIVTAPNATSVDIAGTVTGGGGTAIDLGSGADALHLRSTAQVTGAITLGSGDDRFSFQEGFTVSSPIDGGAGEDAVVADVAAGATRRLDVGTQPVTGFEVIEKLGAGTLVLDGASLPTPYRLDALAGLTTLGRDFTNLSAVIASGARVRNDVELGGVTTQGTGILSGNGTIASLVNNGVVSPGNSIGTITVVGDAAFNAGSVYEVEIEAPDQSDRIDVGGTATINGGVLRIVKLSLDDDYEDGQTYRIITAGDVAVNSAFVFDQPLTLLRTDVEYGADFADLRLTADIPFTTLARTFNQTQAATGLQDMGKTGDGLTVFNEILQLSLLPGGEDAVRRAFDLASGEVHASAQHLVGQGYGLFGQTMMQQGKLPFGPNGGAAVPLGYAPINPDGSVGYSALGYSGEPAPRSLPSGLLAADTPDLPVETNQARLRSVWVAPLGARGQIDGDGNAGTLDWWSGGLAGGMTGALDVASGQAHAGFAVGYIRSRGTVDARLSSVDSDGIHVGVHGAWADGPWSLSGSLAYAGNAISTERRILIGGIDRTAEASYWTHTLGLSGELAYRIETGPATTIAPLATLNASWSGHGGFTETGAGALGLTGAAEDWTRFDTGLGVAIAHSFATESGPVTLEGRAVWEHAFGDVVPDQALSFAGSPTGFTVRGPDAGRDRLRLGAGLSFAASDTLTIRARYDGVFSSNQSSHGASLGFSKKF